jgi:heme/copper-type cytochrome/quinol oxidase subunit 2
MSPEDVKNADADELEEAAEAISKEERRGSLLLWFGVLGSPLAWAGHLGANYSLEEWFACSPSAHDKGEILGFGVEAVLIVINTVMLTVAVLSGLAAWSCRKKLRGARADGEDDGEDARIERARWMAFAGTVEGALFVGIILLGYLPALTLGICETAP